MLVIHISLSYFSLPFLLLFRLLLSASFDSSKILCFLFMKYHHTFTLAWVQFFKKYTYESFLEGFCASNIWVHSEAVSFYCFEIPLVLGHTLLCFSTDIGAFCLKLDSLDNTAALETHPLLFPRLFSDSARLSKSIYPALYSI